jgi:sec-independent protein translocase protein TatA
MPNVGPMELLLVGIIALIVLGPKRLPEVGRSLGKGLREFRESMAGLTDDEEEKRAQAEVEQQQAGQPEQPEEQPQQPATRA